MGCLGLLCKELMLENYSSKITENMTDLIIQKLGKSKEFQMLEESLMLTRLPVVMYAI